MINRTSVNLKNRYLAAFLSFLVPGLGQLYQGRTVKGLIFLFGILGLFLMGMALGGWSIVYWRWVNPLRTPDKFYVWYLGQLPAGLISLPALIQATLSYQGMDPILWGYLAEPSQHAINALYPKLGKLVEMGTIYTEVAGLLNILAIFDAFDGPAYADQAEEGTTSAAARHASAPAASSTTTPTAETATTTEARA